MEEIVHLKQDVKKHTKRVLVVDSDFFDFPNIKNQLSDNFFDNNYLLADYYNVFTLKNEEGVYYLLEIIELLERNSLEQKDFDECYLNFKNICNKWFNHILSLNITDIVCGSPFYPDSNVINELIVWLWSFFVLGKKIKWIPRNNGLFFNDSEYINNEIAKGQVYLSDSVTKITQNDYNYTVYNTEGLIIIGAVNSIINQIEELGESCLYKAPKETIELFKNNNWICDMMTLESHIIGSFGDYNSKQSNSDYKTIVNLLNGREVFGRLKIKNYKNYLLQISKLGFNND